MYGYYYDGSYFLYMFISLAVSMYAHFRVRKAFNKYSQVKCSSGITGVESARRVFEQNGVSGVLFKRINGYFNDCFDSRSNAVMLSDNVYSKSTVAALSVAAHEAGHAVQSAQGYIPLKIREFLVPVTQLGSNLAMPLVFIGLLLPVRYNFIVNLGIILFAVAVLFELITLPVEFDASHRALASLKESGVLGEEEISGAKEVLTAAALTYVAATFTALISLLRLLLISRRRNNF